MPDWIETVREYLRHGRVVQARLLSERHADDPRPLALFTRAECLQHANLPVGSLLDDAWARLDPDADPVLAVNIGIRAILGQGDRRVIHTWLERIRAVAERADDDDLRARVLQAEAKIVRAAGALDRAVELAREAVRLQRGANPISRALAFQCLGQMLFFHADYEGAIAAIEQARHLFELEGHTLGAATLWHLEASTYASAGRHREAIALADQALDAAMKLGFHASVANLYVIKANAYKAIGSRKIALEMCERAIAVAGPDDDGMAAMARGTVSVILASQGRYADARAVVESLVARQRAAGEHVMADLYAAPLMAVAAASRDAVGFEHALLAVRRGHAAVGFLEPDVTEMAMLAGHLWAAPGATREDLGRAVRAFAHAHDAVGARGPEVLLRPAAEGLRDARARGADLPLGRWLLGPLLGAGAMGEVWRAHDPSTGEESAIKLLTVGRLSARHAAQVLAEIRATAPLHHPNIVRLLDHGAVPEHLAVCSGGRVAAEAPYLVMELVRGATLQPLCGRMAWNDLRETLLGLLDALAHAHARGLVHLDVKPDNVLVDTAGQVRLADFGVARALLDGAPEAWAGTPAYMAPEQFERRWVDFGPWTDLYALGCVGWALVTGAPVFGLPPPQEAAARHLREEPGTLSPTVPVPWGMEAWLRKLLAKRPESRFQRASDAAAALVSVGGPMIPARPGSPPPLPGPTLVASSMRDLYGGPSGAQAIVPRPGPLTTLVLPEGAVAATPSPALRSGRPGRSAVVPPSWRPPREPEALATGLALLPLRERRLVARPTEQDLLWQLLREAAEGGRPQVLAMRGAPGLGRSALVGWLGRRAHEIAAALVARSLPTDADPVVGVLERLLRVEGVTEGRERLVAARLEALGCGRTRAANLATQLHQDAVLAQKLDFAAQVVEAAARERPVLLALDDVHRDSAAVELARVLVGVPGPVLVVATCAVAAAPAIDLPWPSIELALLPEEHRRPQVEGLLPLEEEIVGEVAGAAAGNPHLAELCIQLLVERDALTLRHGRVGLRHGLLVAPAASIAAAWEERVARVALRFGPAGVRALRAAAELGTTFGVESWTDVPAGLEERLLAMGMFTRRGDRLAFLHDSAREAAASARSRAAGS